jgi:hypothetical protein
MDQMSIWEDVITDTASSGLFRPTNIEQNGSVKALIHNMVVEDLIIESLWSTFDSRHIGELVDAVESRSVENVEGSVECGGCENVHCPSLRYIYCRYRRASLGDAPPPPRLYLAVCPSTPNKNLRKINQAYTIGHTQTQLLMRDSRRSSPYQNSVLVHLCASMLL